MALLLCRHMSGVLPREKALKDIWGADSYFSTRSMYVYMTKLRKYLAADEGVLIEKVLGSGYRLLLPKGDG